MNKFNLLGKIMGITTVIAVVLAVSVFSVLSQSKKVSASYPCYDPNVVQCGANTPQELVNIMNGADQAGHRDVKEIFDGIGIYENDIISSRMVNGQVYRDGTVRVGGAVVASNVVNGQRGDYGINGPHTNWDGLEWASPSANFKPSTALLDAWVYMPNGQFQYAIIKACGNPVLVPPLHVMPTKIKIKKEVTNLTSDREWRKSNTAVPGNALGYRLLVENISNVSVREIVIKDILPAHLDIIPNTGKLNYGGIESNISDASITGGGRLGVMPPGQKVAVTFAVRVRDDFPAGCTNLINTGSAKGGNTDRVQDTANTLVCLQGQVKYKITVDKYNDLNGDAVRQENEPLLPNWKFTLTGNNLTDTRTTDAGGTITFADLEAGQYTITEEMQAGWKSTTGISQAVTIGPDKTVLFGNQQETPPPPPPTPPTPPTPGQPTSLPVSGPVEAAGGVMGTAGLGYAGYLWRKSRKTLMDNLKKF